MREIRMQDLLTASQSAVSRLAYDLIRGRSRVQIGDGYSPSRAADRSTLELGARRDDRSD